MITIVMYELAVILLYLSLRALWPELFVGGTARVQQAAICPRARAKRSSTAHFIRTFPAVDASRSAGMGMMIR